MKHRKHHSRGTLDPVYGFGGNPKPKKGHHVESGAPTLPVISQGPRTPQTAPSTGSGSSTPPVVHVCPPGQHWDPNVGACVPDTPPPPPGQLNPVTFSPNGGPNSNTNCTLACIDSGAHIFYTVGQTPINPTHTGDTPGPSTTRIGSNSGMANSGPGQSKFKALAYQSGFTDSDITTSNDFGQSTPGLKTLPNGFFRLLPADKASQPLPDQSGDAGWQKPYIDGYRYRATWDRVETSRGVFDFSSIQSLLNLCDQYGKYLTINIAAGKGTPQWVYDAGCQKYHVHDPGASDNPYQPVPWEPLYQTIWFEMIDELAAQFGNHDKLRGMIDCGFMLEASMELGDTTDELGTGGWTPMPITGTGYSYPDVNTAYKTGAKAILDHTFAKFPTIGHGLTFTKTWNGDTISNPERDVRDYYLQQGAYLNGTHPEYVNRTGIIITSARGFEPQKGAPPQSSLSAAPQWAQQFRPMTVFDGNLSHFYVPGGVPAAYPGALICLDDCLEYQWYLGKQYVEIYITDITTDGADSIFELARPKIQSNLLPPP